VRDRNVLPGNLSSNHVRALANRAPASRARRSPPALGTSEIPEKCVLTADALPRSAMPHAMKLTRARSRPSIHDTSPGGLTLVLPALNFLRWPATSALASASTLAMSWSCLVPSSAIAVWYSASAWISDFLALEPSRSLVSFSSAFLSAANFFSIAAACFFLMTATAACSLPTVNEPSICSRRSPLSPSIHATSRIASAASSSCAAATTSSQVGS
jgi:hypothetical protein